MVPGVRVGDKTILQQSVHFEAFLFRLFFAGFPVPPQPLTIRVPPGGPDRVMRPRGRSVRESRPEPP